MIATEAPAAGAGTIAPAVRLTPTQQPFYSFDGCWVWTTGGWLPVAGTHPLPPCPDRPVRHLRIVPDGWTT